ncbi:MAG: O-antigen ligase family protein [Acidobacteriota bacterium]
MFNNLMLKLRALNEDIELISILIFLIFFPEKSSFYYFMIFAVLIILFLIRKILISKNIGVSNFTKALLIINILLLISTLFSVYFLKSILFFFDVFLISTYFILHLIEEREEERNIQIFGTIISIYSGIFLVIYLFSGARDLFFSNPIMSGITSGAGSLIFLYYFLRDNKYIHILIAALNISALYVSESKAAFLGAAIFSLIMVLCKKKKGIPVVLILIIMTFIIPNPIRNMFHHSIYEDPYSTDRVKIWGTGLKIFMDNPIAGIGADNFGELSKKYNFRQEKGPANYFKLPRTPHSDYIKILAELGLFGMAILLFSLFFILRKVLQGPLFNISKVLILYLLFQALFFNIIFQTFFLFLFIFLLKTLFKSEIDFQSNSGAIKFISILTLIIVVFLGYIFPYFSELLVTKSTKQKDLVKVFNQLNKAEDLNKMNISPYYYRALLLLGQFKKTSDPVFIYSAMDNVRNILRINPYYSKAYFLESDIFRSILEKGIQYPGLQEEVLSPLNRLEKIDPYNPFIRIEKAHFLLQFGNPVQARSEALNALKLEPKFISAIYFLHKNFNYFGNTSVFMSRINSILRSTKGWAERDSSYLNGLIKIPKELTDLMNTAPPTSD